jgi:hypothetical protein
MDCNSARRYNDDTHCGPQAKHFAARGYPAWLWPVGSIIGGFVAVAAFFLLLMFLFSHLLPAHAAERTLDWDRHYERYHLLHSGHHDPFQLVAYRALTLGVQFLLRAADAGQNVQWQTVSEARAKDRWETKGRNR